MFEDNSITLFTLRAHVRTLTNPHGEAPFEAVTKGKALCAVVVPWQPGLLTAAAVVVVLEKQQQPEV